MSHIDSNSEEEINIDTSGTASTFSVTTPLQQYKRFVKPIAKKSCPELSTPDHPAASPAPQMGTQNSEMKQKHVSSSQFLICGLNCC